MKNRKLIYPILMLLCIVVFAGYMIIDRVAEDNTAPVIDIVGELQMETAADDSVFLQGVTATDNRDGDVTASVIVADIELVDRDGTVSVTYAAFDKAGNVAKEKRTAVYTDYVGPRFTLRSPLVFGSTNFDVFSIVGAEDQFDGNIQHRIRVNVLGEETISSVGIHDVQFRVTNSLGDTVEIIMPVEVYTSGKYNASLTLTDYMIYLPVGADFDEDDYVKSIICYGDEIDLHSTNRAYIRTNGKVDTNTPGVYTVSYEVTYNQMYTGYSKLVVVVEG